MGDDAQCVAVTVPKAPAASSFGPAAKNSVFVGPLLGAPPPNAMPHRPSIWIGLLVVAPEDAVRVPAVATPGERVDLAVAEVADDEVAAEPDRSHSGPRRGPTAR